MDNKMLHERGHRVDHEDRDVNVRAVLWFGVALIAVAIVVHLSLWFLFKVYRHQAAPKDLPASMVQGGRAASPPEPRLQPCPNCGGELNDPPKDLDDMRAEEQKALDSYGWVDQQAGVVHIPIEQAMKLAVQKGTYIEQKVAGPATVAAPPVTVPGAAGSGTQTQPPPQTSTGAAAQGAAHP